MKKVSKILLNIWFGICIIIYIILCHGIAMFFSKLTGFYIESGMVFGAVIGWMAYYMFGNKCN